MSEGKQGFSLIEIAIVLAVIGTVIGGIYVAAANVTDSTRSQKARSQVLQIISVTNAAVRQNVDLTGMTTAQMQTARMLPTDMIPTGTNSVTWPYGTMGIYFYASAKPRVYLQLSGITSKFCNDLLTISFTPKILQDYGISFVNPQKYPSTYYFRPDDAAWPVSSIATACANAATIYIDMYPNGQ